MKKSHRRFGLLRRGAALGLTLATALFISQTADLNAAKEALFGSEKVAKRLLELELGKLEEEDALEGWVELVVDQSPVLSSEKEAVSSYLKEQAARQEMQAEASVPKQDEPAPEPEPEIDPADEGEASLPAEQSEEETEPEPEPEPEPAAFTLDLSEISPSDIELVNHTDHQDEAISKYWKKTPALTLKSSKKGPQILIMHTHATEAYTMADGDDYTESDESRTTDENYNMIRVGEEMKAVFEEQGFSVLHDKTTYDYPGYNGSYGRSLAGVEAYLEEYPTIQMVLDVHRDALIDADGTVYSKTTSIDGEKVAQVMLVVGTDDGGLTHPEWRDNYTLALKIQGAMLSIDSTFPRPIDLRSQRFNQHLRPGSLLVEVGTSGNTLKQALAGARLFAEAVCMELNECKE